jgi:hypothetical protein
MNGVLGTTVEWVVERMWATAPNSGRHKSVHIRGANRPLPIRTLIVAAMR